LKAIFEMGPFKTIMNIGHAYPDYYFAVMEQTYNPFRLVEPGCENAVQTPVKKLKFRLETYETIMLMGEMVYLPFYRFVRID